MRARLEQVPDPPRRQGLRHGLSSVLMIVLCALAADKDSYTHIEAWARDAPPRVLSALGVRFDVFTAAHTVPDESTLRDVMARIDPEALAAVQAAYLAGLAEGRAAVRTDAPDEREARRAARTAAPAPPVPALAGNGKRLAGAVTGNDHRGHLASLVTHASGATVAQCPTAGKGGEAAAARRLLASADVTGSMVTFDVDKACAALNEAARAAYALATALGKAHSALTDVGGVVDDQE